MTSIPLSALSWTVTPPTVQDANTYLGPDNPYYTDPVLVNLATGAGFNPALVSAFAAEFAAQLRVCRVPVDPESGIVTTYPADLAEALFRRVAHNLALRDLPLGVQPSSNDTTALNVRVGGEDAEVRRLERPFKKLVLG